MMRMIRNLAASALVALIATTAFGQSRDETLADIRQDLSFLHVEIQRLKQELSTTGNSQTSTGQGTNLQRLDAVEGELQRITGKIEELEFRIQRIVKDGTNRIGDLEFRLVELEGGNVSSLGETSTLGGQDLGRTTIPVAPPSTTNSELAVSEQVDFEAAQGAYDNAEYRRAADLFEAFTAAYPGGPLAANAHYWRGESLAELELWSAAARSFLQSFSSAPDSDLAPQALFRLGISLDRIGQREEACLTLNEVGLRYPGSGPAESAADEMSVLGCAS